MICPADPWRIIEAAREVHGSDVPLENFRQNCHLWAPAETMLSLGCFHCGAWERGLLSWAIFNLRPHEPDCLLEAAQQSEALPENPPSFPPSLYRCHTCTTVWKTSHFLLIPRPFILAFPQCITCTSNSLWGPLPRGLTHEWNDLLRLLEATHSTHIPRLTSCSLTSPATNLSLISDGLHKSIKFCTAWVTHLILHLSHNLAFVSTEKHTLPNWISGYIMKISRGTF